MMEAGSPPRVVEPVKVCSRCKAKKPWSAYYAKTRWPDGTMRQPQSRCRECMATVSREHPEWRRKHDRKRYKRTREDPEAWAQRLAEHRERYRARASDPEWLAARLAQVREAKRARRGVTPDRFRMGSVEGLRVPAAPLRAAFERSGMTAAEVAHRMGWTPGGKADTSRVARTLSRPTVPLMLARGLCDALLVDPVEVGL